MSHPLSTDGAEPIGTSRDRGSRARVDLKFESGREPDGAEHAEPVLLEPVLRISDRPQHAGLQVLTAADEVDDPTRTGILEESVDREVPPPGVRFGGTEGNLDRAAAVVIGAVGPKGRDLDHPPARGHQHDPEMRADAAGLRKEPRDLVRHRCGGDVNVGGVETEQVIPHTAPREVRLMPRLPQRRRNPARRLSRFESSRAVHADGSDPSRTGVGPSATPAAG